MNALIFAPSGGGKTVNSTRVATRSRGRNLLICTDNSYVVLQNFPRKNLDILPVGTSEDFVKGYEDAIDSKKYDNIILDNLSDLFDMWILELSPQTKDVRQAYQYVYQHIKMLTRKSTMADVDTIFTAWTDTMEFTDTNGEKKQRLQPKLPYKILDNVCGLMNVVAYCYKNANGDYMFHSEGAPTLMAKDQIACRVDIEPEKIFERKDNK